MNATRCSSSPPKLMTVPNESSDICRTKESESTRLDLGSIKPKTVVNSCLVRSLLRPKRPKSRQQRANEQSLVHQKWNEGQTKRVSVTCIVNAFAPWRHVSRITGQ